MRGRSPALFALVALAACSPTPPTNAPSANAPANVATNAAAAPAGSDPRMAKIFAPDILGANLSYLETITGPAFTTEASVRTYKVGDCQVVVGVTGGKIDNIGIGNYSAACSFPIAQYFAGGYQPPVP